MKEIIVPRLRSPWVLLLLVSLLLHFWRLSFPAAIAFDESLVGHFASYYYRGEYYFDIHPPHLKLIYAGLGWLAGVPADFTFQPYNDPYPGNFYLLMRCFPALCGSVLPLLLVRLALDFGVERRWAFSLGWLMMLDTALLVESRFILNDIPLLTFGLGGWVGLSRWWQHGRWRWLLLGSLGVALAGTVKWTGLGIAIPAFAGLLLGRKIDWPKRWRGLLVLATMIFTVQVSGFVLHMALLPKPGPGDAFMTQPMQEKLKEQRANPESNLLFMPRAVYEINYSMAFHASRVADHPYSSPWYDWPLGRRGIYVWMNGDTPPARIYLLPNVAIWWPLAFAAVYYFFSLLQAILRLPPAGEAEAEAPPPSSFTRRDLLLLVAYLGNFLPFIFIGRAMFIYHYFPALAVSYVIAGRLLTQEHIDPRWRWLWLGAAALMFLWLLPLVYGYPVEQSTFEVLMLLKSWI